eukprot:CAMPEP_0113948938 /NCGR_PEP_ID=MMETSP1339-20121228/72936_1 /TAXON_ID=94617 /ORGANISM="Fibrocapsa japonica" /LENGTH=129 /DNA_ID=CAMNT_0000956177 /DNA_START=75 /DNA_END=460 /DNA_ORIENTATION=- /assembly_acc=CAM_ASM_000762
MAQKWVVLETPVPAEDVVACAMIEIDPPAPQGGESRSCREGHVHYLAVHPELQRKGLGSYLLRKVERILANYGVSSIVLQFSHHREDVSAWLTRLGYKEKGGGMWPDNLQHELTRPSRYLVFKRPIPAA